MGQINLPEIVKIPLNPGGEVPIHPLTAAGRGNPAGARSTGSGFTGRKKSSSFFPACRKPLWGGRLHQRNPAGLRRIFPAFRFRL